LAIGAAAVLADRIVAMKPWPGRMLEEIKRRPVGTLDRSLPEKKRADYRRVARPAGCCLCKS
jgi:hypothetical protein